MTGKSPLFRNRQHYISLELQSGEQRQLAALVLKLPGSFICRSSLGGRISLNIQGRKAGVSPVKKLSLCLMLSVLLISCGGKQDKVSSDNSATQTKATETTRAESPTPTAATPALTKKNDRPPVEFTYLGVTPDKEAIAYKITVNAAEPISQVDLDVKYLDEGSRVIDETTLAWQNVIKSTRYPIKKGMTYEAKDYLPEGATKAECVLRRVIFADGTRWNAN
jgi:hypothetical protein